MKNNDYLLKKLEEIENHFANISEEEFQENLVKAGFGEIQSLAESSLDLLCEEIIEESLATEYCKRPTGYIYNRNYKYSNFRNSDTTYPEVA